MYLSFHRTVIRKHFLPALLAGAILRLVLPISAEPARGSEPGKVSASSTPQIVELSVGETVEVPLAAKKKVKVRLLGLREIREPYYQSEENSFVEAVVAAQVQLEVHGKRAEFTGGPGRLPTRAGGLNILLSGTRDWSGGIEADPLIKDVRLEVKDARLPWCDVEALAFPLRDYLWRAVNYQNTFLGIAAGQERLYYHRGEDLGALPDRLKVSAISAGTVAKAPGPHGDGESNNLILRAAEGLEFLYAHMNAPHVRADLAPGVPLSLGEELGLSGNTWQGKPVQDPHLHVELAQNGVYRNTFPLFAAAYQHERPNAVVPYAGRMHFTYRGETVDLDGRMSIPPAGQKIRSWDWIMTDGKTSQERTVRRTYNVAGVFTEQLKVTASGGAMDTDFVEVYVFDRDRPAPPPYAMIYYFPVKGIQPRQEVEFDVRTRNMEKAVIDFGDGTHAPLSGVMRHAYERRGQYVVTVRGQRTGGVPGTYKVRVNVGRD